MHPPVPSCKWGGGVIFQVLSMKAGLRKAFVLFGWVNFQSLKWNKLASHFLIQYLRQIIIDNKEGRANHCH